MAAHSGPNAVTENLVFAYDMGNTEKSWLGKPTENLAASKFFTGNGNFTTNVTIQDTLPDGSIGPVRYLNADFVNDVNRTVSIGNYSLTAGETYTLSFYVKNISCTGFNGNLYSPGLGRVIGGIGYPTVYTDRWTRVVKTFTVPDEGVNPVTLAPQVFRDGGYGFFKLSWLQMEAGSIATPYIQGTRSNTQSILDITGQKTATAQNLSYNSDNTFEFDGVDDILYLNYGNALNPTITSITVSAWVKSNTTSGTRMWLDAGGSNGSNQRFYSGLNTSSGHAFGSQSSAWSSGSVPVDTDWHYQAIVMDANSNTAYVYDDAELLFIRYYTSYAFVGDLRFGGRTGYPWQGKIDAVKVYNQPLTASEIKANFNATRGRHGI